MTAIVPIIMGSRADLAQAQAIAEALKTFGLTSEIRVGSAHKTPAHVLAILQAYEADPRPKVYITIAGRSNALSGFIDAQVTSPVIACPPVSNTFAGADIYSSLRMPSGVAPAVIIEPTGAALLAAKILALGDPALKARIEAYQRKLVDTIVKDDQEVKGNG